MRIEVTYIDDSEPKKRPKFHLPKRTAKPAPVAPVEHVKRAKPANKPAKPAKTTKTTAVAKAAKQRRRLPRPVRNVLISAAVLLLLLVGAGVLYTLFADGGAVPTATASIQPVSSTSNGEIKPSKPAPNIPESAAVEMVTSPVAPGAQASVSIHTNPGSTCTIAVVYDYNYEKKQPPVSDPALGKQTADDFGMVSWNWNISPTAPLGPGRATVLCTYHTRRASVIADLLITK